MTSYQRRFDATSHRRRSDIILMSCACWVSFFPVNMFVTFVMPPTLKKLEGHIAFGLSVCVSVCVLTFEW